MIKSLHYKIPTDEPFDADNWFETFVGNFIMPIVESGFVHSFWFTRYEDPNIGKHGRLRLLTDDPDAVEVMEDELSEKWNLQNLKDELDYDAKEMKGEGRFLGVNQRQKNGEERFALTWNFLHASSVLFMDCLSHHDNEGRWYLESNLDLGNNIDGNTLETAHHLFCNLTQIDPRVDAFIQKTAQGALVCQLMSGHYRRWNGIPDSVVSYTQRVRF